MSAFYSTKNDVSMYVCTVADVGATGQLVNIQYWSLQSNVVATKIVNLNRMARMHRR
jgi:hypothetical protein